MFAQLSELQVENVKVHKLSEEQKELKSRLSEAEEARIQAQDQVCAPDQDCRGVQSDKRVLSTGTRAAASLTVSKPICFRTNSFNASSSWKCLRLKPGLQYNSIQFNLFIYYYI